MVWLAVCHRRLHQQVSSLATALRLVHAELDRRYQYVPALVLAAAETVGSDLVAPVTGARTLAMRIREEELDLRRQAGAEKALSAALQAVLQSGRRYPQLAHDWAFVRPAHELELIETRLAGAVRVYNDQARRLNSALTAFPTRVLAARAGIAEAQAFEATILEVHTSEPGDGVVAAAA